MFAHLKKAFLSRLLIDADNSVDHAKNSTTAAAIITALVYEWKGRHLFKTTSTTAEFVTIQLALQYLLTLQTPREVVILTDSRGFWPKYRVKTKL